MDLHDTPQTAAEAAVIQQLLMDKSLAAHAAGMDRHCFSSLDVFRIFNEVMAWTGESSGSELIITQRLEKQWPGGTWTNKVLDLVAAGQRSALVGGAAFISNVHLLRSISSSRAGLICLTEAASAAYATDYAGAAKAAQEAVAAFSSLNGSGGLRLSPIGDAAKEVLARATEMRPHIGPPVGIGYFDVGYAQTIFAPGKLVVLAARPGVGKTALALQLSIAMSESFGVGYWSCEMDAEELAARVIASMTGVKLARLTAARCGPNELALVRESVGQIVEMPILFDDSASANVHSLAALARETKNTYGSCGVIVADYFQSMSSLEKHSTLHASLGEVSRALKAMARSLGMAVVLPTQLNRKIEDRDDGNFRMSDLGECGRLEQDADSIFYLDRPFARNRGASPAEASLYSAKVRGSIAGMRAALSFDGETQTFKDAI